MAGHGRVINWLARVRQEPAAMVTLIVVAAGIWSFGKLAEAVTAGSTESFDERIVLALRNPADLADPVGPPWVEEMLRDFTALGGVAVLTGLTLAASIWLALEGERRLAIVLVVAVLGGLLTSSLLKLQFERPRPQLVPHGSYVYSHSFPSGHAMMSAATYLTLAVMIASSRGRKSVRVFVLLFALLLTVLVGLSRVYLGVHWPTDVLAGWIGGAVWALTVWYVAGLWCPTEKSS